MKLHWCNILRPYSVSCYATYQSTLKKHPKLNPSTVDSHPADGLNWTTSPTNSSSGSGIIITLDTEPMKNQNPLPFRSSFGLRQMGCECCVAAMKEIPGMRCWVDKRQNPSFSELGILGTRRCDLGQQNDILHQHQFWSFQSCLHHIVYERILRLIIISLFHQHHHLWLGPEFVFRKLAAAAQLKSISFSHKIP